MSENNFPTYSLEDVQLTLLSDGTFWLDGGAMFGRTPKVHWQQKTDSDEKNRIPLGLNSLLVQKDGLNILIEAGTGEGHSEKFSQIFRIERERHLLEELEILGLSPAEIHHVILTHLHFDHSGWLSRPDGNGTFALTFPNAVIWIQKSQWEEAIQPHRTVKASYLQDRLSPLKGNPRLRLLEGDCFLFGNWLECRLTPGHTEGHQSVLIHGHGGTVCYTGDLIPTAAHVEVPCIMAYDRYPRQSYESKKALLQEAKQKGWCLVFPHERAQHFYQIPEELLTSSSS